MTDIKLNSNGNVSLWWVPTSGLANWQAPTAPEINAGVFLGDATSWNDYGVGVQASDVKSDPAVSAKNKVNVRGASKYGGGISFYYPAVFGDASNNYSVVYDLFSVPGTTGYLIVRVDGEVLTSGAATASQPAIAATANDLVHIMKVTSDSWTDAISGEDAFRYTINFVSQGQLNVYSVVRASAAAPTVAILPLTATFVGASGGKGSAAATVNTRKYTRGVKWTSSVPAKVTVSNNGVWTGVVGAAAGTVNITAVHPETNTTSTAPLVITIT
jgi:hypothetical protein